jgi:hypothetical protein
MPKAIGENSESMGAETGERGNFSERRDTQQRRPARVHSAFEDATRLEGVMFLVADA